MSNDIVLYQPYQGISVASSIGDISAMMGYNKALKERETQKIIQAVSNNLYDMAAEYIWSRTVNILRNTVMQLGEEFVAEMLDRPDVSSVDSISEYEIITLAADLGVINKTAKMEFLQFSEILQHFMSNEDLQEEYPLTKLTDMVRSCICHVLGTDKVTYEIPFMTFRNQLKCDNINKSHPLHELLLTAPYFYKKTVTKTLLNLVKTLHDGAERETVCVNMGHIIPSIWPTLSSDDRWAVGRSYAQANNDGDIPLSKSLKSILIKIKGFDYVPENLRSNSYITAAKNLLSTHFAMNNFYNEPNPAKILAEMGSSIPAPAFSSCITAVLACKLGNSYGRSNLAQGYLDEILNKISSDRWVYYFNNIFPTDEVILYKLSTLGDPLSRFKELVKKYDLNALPISTADSIKVLKNLATNNPTSAANLCYSIHSKLS